MDQTPIYFSMLPATTLELQGANRVSMKATANSTKQATCSLCISADGDKLKPMLIFICQHFGRFDTHKFPMYENVNSLYLTCQANA